MADGQEISKLFLSNSKLANFSPTPSGCKRFCLFWACPMKWYLNSYIFFENKDKILRYLLALLGSFLAESEILMGPIPPFWESSFEEESWNVFSFYKYLYSVSLVFLFPNKLIRSISEASIIKLVGQLVLFLITHSPLFRCPNMTVNLIIDR